MRSCGRRAAAPPRDQVNVRVEYRLPRQGAAVHANVERPHRLIAIDNPLPDLLYQPVHRPHFAIV